MNKSLFKHLVSLFLFGLNGIIASKIALESYQIVLFRTMLGSLLLLLLFLLRKNRFSFAKNKRDMLFILASGVAMGASWMFLYEAYSQIGVGIATLLYYIGPVFVMALSPLFFKEKLTIVKFIGFEIVLLGFILINGQADKDLNYIGVICALLSAVTYAVMVITNKKSKKICGMENSLLQLAAAFVTVGIFVGIKDVGYSMSVRKEDVFWILLLGLINTGVGCYLYFSSIGDLGAQTVAILGYAEPLSAIVLSVVILGEKMSLFEILGGVLIIGGAAIAQLWKTPKKTKAP